MQSRSVVKQGNHSSNSHLARMVWLEKLDADVAQLARAVACHATGRGFEPLRPLHLSPSQPTTLLTDMPLRSISMAYWQRTKSGRIKIYTAGGKYLPKRGLYDHLDHEPDHNVEFWVRDWEQRNESPTPALDTRVPDRLQRHKDNWLAHLTNRGRSPKTVNQRDSMVRKFVFPYFITACGLDDPNEWPKVSAKLAEWAREAGASESQISRTNTALRDFWRWLADEGAVLGSIDLRLRQAYLSQQPTPLQRTWTPDEMLSLAESLSEDLRLVALLGYFASLRPQEIFGLRRNDFFGKRRAPELECSRVMRRYGFYTDLAVRIERQRLQSGAMDVPKSRSKGMVSVFNKRAAVEIAKLIRGLETDAELFAAHGNDYYLKKWRKEAGMETKDLRRASLYWLGHYGGLDLVPLKNHARHAKIETTMQYVRRPEDIPDTSDDDLDLDA